MIEIEEIEKTASLIVRKLESRGEQEISSDKIGAEVMEALQDLDAIGYIRYASVYKDFRKPDDFNAFLDEVKTLQSKSK